MERIGAAPVGSRNVELGKQCLKAIRDLAERGASSHSPNHIGYVLLELTQVLLEWQRCPDKRIEPVSVDELKHLDALYEELDWVNGFSQDMAYRERQ